MNPRTNRPAADPLDTTLIELGLLGAMEQEPARIVRAALDRGITAADFNGVRQEIAEIIFRLYDSTGGAFSLLDVGQEARRMNRPDLEPIMDQAHDQCVTVEHAARWIDQLVQATAARRARSLAENFVDRARGARPQEAALLLENLRDQLAQVESLGDGALILPSDTVTISACAEELFKRAAPSHTLFMRGGAVTQLASDPTGRLRLEVVKPAAFRSLIESHGMLLVWRIGRDGQKVLKPTTLPADMAEALLQAEPAQRFLPAVRGIVGCPILANDDGRPRLLCKGYHAHGGGILVTAGDTPPDLPLEEAVEILRGLVSEFDFQSPGDRSRAIASFITPALRLGSWIDGHVPADVAEADQSQSGKTYRQKLVAAVYNEAPTVIGIRTGGVGGMDESVQQAMVEGRPFIQIDNVRGRVESQWIEALLTAGGFIGCRVPRQREVQVDSRHFILMLTSNGVEATRDLANRSSIVRIRKRRGYSFMEYPEGDLLSHIRAHQPRHLGAAFAVIREWADAGRQRTRDTRHDFREWNGCLDWIVQNIMQEAPLMDGHEAAQLRVSNPALTFLRLVALAVERAGRLGEPIHASGIGELCEDQGVEIPGLRGLTDADRSKGVGRMLKRAFGEGDSVEVDGYTVGRTEEEKYYAELQQYKLVKAYSFMKAGGTAPTGTPNQPEQPYIESRKPYHFISYTDPCSGSSGLPAEPTQAEPRQSIEPAPIDPHGPDLAPVAGQADQQEALP